MTYNLLRLAAMLKTNNGYLNYGNSREQWEDGEHWNFENPEYRYLTQLPGTPKTLRIY